ncbi:cytochrome P450 6A1 [Frankliniella occidentalis]|uniref:Cytochrome P450 6A1 n=1 Tax=Frankliniella occidentalis TaxID=133901 RepID=A0A9C6XV00_FRAOC|nr:cytochrome P450 6A1 [Frankliniella occidentalis]
MLVMLVVVVCGGALALVAALYAYLRHSMGYWQRRKVPVVPAVMPWGNFADSILGRKSLFQVADDVYRRHRDERYIGTYFSATPLLHLHDPEIIRQVFTKEFQDFNGRGMYSDHDYDPLTGHLFMLSGKPWRNMRVKLSPTFTTGKIKYMFNTISECAGHLREHVDSSLKAGGGLYQEDVRELVARFTTDIISSVAFGIESNSMKNPESEFRRMGQRIFDPCFDVNIRALLTFFDNTIMRLFRIRALPDDVNSFFINIVDEMVTHRERNGVERADMLNLLIKLKNEVILTRSDFNGRGVHSDPENDPLSGHLFMLSGQPWRNMRVKLSPTFTTGKIKYMFNTISECAGYLREHVDTSLKTGGGLYQEDVRELVARFSTDIISSVAFGIETNSMKDPESEFRRMGQRIFEPSLDVNLRALLAFFGGNIMKLFRIRGNPYDVHAFFTRIVDEMVTHRERNGVERADMLNLLIKLKNEGFVPPDAHGEHADKGNGATNGTNGVSQESRTKLTQKEIAAQVFVFFIAGFETTSTTTSFALYELAKHPDVQEKVLQEIDATLKKYNGQVTYEAIMDMPYMEMVIQGENSVSAWCGHNDIFADHPLSTSSFRHGTGMFSLSKLS